MGYASLGERQLLFVTGKGGVGKTTVAAALAQTFAERGKSVLLVAIDERSDLADAFALSSLTFEPVEVAPCLSVMALNTESALREYLRQNLKLPIPTKLGPLANALDFVATAAPGVREILTVGKLCYEVRERHYDLVIADAPASGHVVGYLAAPEAIRDLVRVGLIRYQTEWMTDILHDAARTGVVAVTTPEEMPVVETQQLIHRLRDETHVALASVVVNRMPSPVALGTAHDATMAFVDEMAPAFPHLAAAVRLEDVRRVDAERYCRMVIESVGERCPVVVQPVVEQTEAVGDVVAAVATHFADEVA